MFNITDYLSKFNKLTLPDESLRRAVCELLQEELGVALDRKYIKVHNRVIYVTASPVIKNEIFLRKEFFIQKIKEISQDKIIEDIK